MSSKSTNNATAGRESVIAIMGATGSGKSTFINIVSGSCLAVGAGLKSCTTKVETGNSFKLDGRLVTLIDTPGFDDTTVSDTDILKMIAVHLSTAYKTGHTLTGVIYMHRISDFRVGGIAKKNFNMFRQLCGDETLKNLVLVTNMWGTIPLELGEAREKELRTDEILFKPVIDKGAQMLRHYHNPESAKAILRHMLKNHPLPLQIQRELVDQGMDITQTAAGKELDRELAAMAARHAQELAEVQKEMDSVAAKNKEMQQELEEVRQGLVDSMNKIQNDRERLSREYEEERKKAEERMKQVEAALAEERKMRAERQKEIETLMKQLEENTRASAAERAQWLAKMDQLQRQIDDAGDGSCRIF